jgi:hypothetical protein
MVRQYAKLRLLFRIDADSSLEHCRRLAENSEEYDWVNWRRYLYESTLSLKLTQSYSVLLIIPFSNLSFYIGWVRQSYFQLI